jgi:hypothetical protein
MRRTVTLLVLSLLAVLGVAGTASAGGPTSVVITVPGEGRSAGLYYTDPAYDRLAEAVGIGRQVDGGVDPGGFGTQTPVTLTWLIHDVTPWRVDRVFTRDGTVWVMTQEDFGGGALGDVAPVWHRAGPELARILDQVLPDGNGYARDTVLDARPDPVTPAATPAVAQPAAARTSPLLLAGIGLGGLLVGVLGTLTAFAVRRPGEAATPADPEVPAGEQLVWP